MSEMSEEFEKVGNFLFPDIKKIDLDDIEAIAHILEYRIVGLRESTQLALGVALLNYGDRYTEVECVNGEWSGIKKDLQSSGGIPTCPNGHVMLEKPGHWVLALIKES